QLGVTFTRTVGWKRSSPDEDGEWMLERLGERIIWTRIGRLTRHDLNLFVLFEKNRVRRDEDIVKDILDEAQCQIEEGVNAPDSNHEF
ncbi:hypothetical protein TNIN_125731, partial [Trichonephila inaurata madagascariensis]